MTDVGGPDGLCLSPQRIYQHIRADRQAGGTLYHHLRHSRKKRKKRYGKADARGQIKDRVSFQRQRHTQTGKNQQRLALVPIFVVGVLPVAPVRELRPWLRPRRPGSESGRRSRRQRTYPPAVGAA